jgi:autotransporter adhesin
MNAEMANRSLINTNASDIAANQGHLRQLDADVDMLRSGVAMSMALAGMPTTDGDGTGFAIGVGNFDGESAVAMGFTHKSRRAAYKLGLTHAGGETGVSAGASWKISK